MGDYFPGDITIGGQITRKRLPELIAAINAADVQLEYSADKVRFGTEQELLAALDEDGHLCLYDEEASYGHFEDLEQTCQELGLEFDRRADAYGEYSAEFVVLRDGKETWHPADQVGNILIARSDLQPAVAALREGRAEEALALLRALQADPPVLPRFEVVARRRRRKPRTPAALPATQARDPFEEAP